MGGFAIRNTGGGCSSQPDGGSAEAIFVIPAKAGIQSLPLLPGSRPSPG
ncbi:MAG: hypothetical protein ABW155_06625 [Candidatus Thiodiazotropha sp.]